MYSLDEPPPLLKSNDVLPKWCLKCISIFLIFSKSFVIPTMLELLGLLDMYSSNLLNILLCTILYHSKLFYLPLLLLFYLIM